MKHVAILGAGGWGTSLGSVLARAGQKVTLWGRPPEFIKEFKRTRENSTFLPGIQIPESVEITSDPPDADVYVVAIPTPYIRDTLGKMKDSLDASKPFVSLAKGIERGTFRRPTEIITEALGAKQVAVLSGPSHAEEVARGMPTTLVLAAERESLAEELRPVFQGETLRVYTGDDPRGVEIAGALKNVIAIAAGISDGLGLGDNAKAALLSRGIVEMSRLGEALGAKRRTFYGLSGIGDLITTCVSRHGRNLAVGRAVGEGGKPDDILSKTGMVAEGVWTSRAALDLARKHSVETPIIDEVCRVLFENKAPRDAVRDLMVRMPKSEGEDLR